MKRVWILTLEHNPTGFVGHLTTIKVVFSDKPLIADIKKGFCYFGEQLNTIISIRNIAQDPEVEYAKEAELDLRSLFFSTDLEDNLLNSPTRKVVVGNTSVKLRHPELIEVSNEI